MENTAENEARSHEKKIKDYFGEHVRLNEEYVITKNGYGVTEIVGLSKNETRGYIFIEQPKEISKKQFQRKIEQLRWQYELDLRAQILNFVKDTNEIALLWRARW